MAALPEKYLACLLQDPESPWKLTSVPLEHPEKNQILVKVQCCGFCHTDTAAQSGQLNSIMRWPAIPGHEIIGIVVLLGEGVDKWKVGDRVGGCWHGGHDNTCRQCRQGFPQGCDNQLINGISKTGGFAEYCVLNSEAAVRILSDKKATDLAPLLCAGVTIFNAMRHQGIMSGETVAIQGLGGLGHLGIQYAAKMGFRVVAISGNEGKRDDAMGLGASHFINTGTHNVNAELEKLGGAKMIVLTAPNPDLMGDFAAALTWQGRLVILAPVGDIKVDTTQLIHKSCSLSGWHAGHALDCEDALDFAELHGIQCYVETFPLADIEEAAQHLLSGNARYRVVLEMDK